MKKYNLIVYGWGVSSSSHSITSEQVDILNKIRFEMDTENLSDISTDIEYSIHGYTPFDTNMWVIDKPLYNTKLQFEVIDENKNVILDFNIDEIENKLDIDEENDVKIYNAYPTEGGQKNILLWVEENKGLLCTFPFETDDEVKVEDFNYLTSIIETPDGDWELVEDILYGNKILQIDYDDSRIEKKSLTVNLYELKKLN
jgi:hypothetical protein